MKLFDRLFANDPIEKYPTSNGKSLSWNTTLGIGFLPSNGYDYGDEYWEKYQSYIDNGIGLKLTQFRKRFVLDNIGGAGSFCDVGIGSGQFVAMLGCKGFDVNPHAQAWLKQRGSFGDPYKQHFTSLSFWDVLEHIEDPSPLLGVTTKHVFVSLPIHKNVQACLASKHLRPDEHLWHFTESGIKRFMQAFGYMLINKSDEETRIGREDIMAYFFSR